MGSLHSFLGVSDDADWATITAAWKDIARECHPDRSDDPRDHHRYASASHAYKQLREERRGPVEDDRLDPWDALDGFATLAEGDERPTVAAPLPPPPSLLVEPPATTRRDMLRRLVSRD